MDGHVAPRQARGLELVETAALLAMTILEVHRSYHRRLGVRSGSRDDNQERFHGFDHRTARRGRTSHKHLFWFWDKARGKNHRVLDVLPRRAARGSKT